MRAASLAFRSDGSCAWLVDIVRQVSFSRGRSVTLDLPLALNCAILLFFSFMPCGCVIGVSKLRAQQEGLGRRRSETTGEKPGDCHSTSVGRCFLRALGVVSCERDKGR
ncbi:hypothetical protein MRX96_010381 [Rhipicephalus microplus]